MSIVRRCLEHVDSIQTRHPYLHRNWYRRCAVDVHPISLLVRALSLSHSAAATMELKRVLGCVCFYLPWSIVHLRYLIWIGMYTFAPFRIFEIDFVLMRSRADRFRPGEDVRPDDQRPHPPAHRTRASAAVGLEGARRASRHHEDPQAGLPRLECRRYADTVRLARRRPADADHDARSHSRVHHLQLHRKLGDDAGA